MSVALLYFAGDLLTRAFTLPLGVLRVGSALVPFIFAPALPLRLLVPGLSLTIYLIVACLGWGVLAQLFVLVSPRLLGGRRTGA